MKLRCVLAALICSALLAGCARQVPSSERPEIDPVLLEEGAAVLSDGTVLDRCQAPGGGDSYLLPDGTALLNVDAPTPEELGNFDSSEEFQALSKPAREVISGWFQRRGLLFELDEELERAYEAYKSLQEAKRTYYTRYANQMDAVEGANSRLIFFNTHLALSTDRRGYMDVRNFQTVFDRETGEEMPVWDLFTVPEEEARRVLLREMRPAAVSDPPEAREAIAAALEPEYISIGAESLQVWFPQGTLPEGEHDGWQLYYEEHPALLDILQPWAVPDAEKSGNPS